MRTFMLAVVLGLSVGCQTAYYNTMERLGVQKREILVDRVGDARDAQEAAKQQFEDALEQFRAIVEVDAGELEATYDRLRREYDRSVTRAETVSERIDSVEHVAAALFAEWEGELGEYESAELRAQSRRQLKATRRQYDQLMQRMRDAESTMAPVLAAFRDQVLTLKHNLNARAIAALRGEVRSVEADIKGLIEEMEAAIAAADEFLARLER